jgi:hypothetical protein
MGLFRSFIFFASSGGQIFLRAAFVIRWSVLFFRSKLDLTRAAHSGVNAEFRQNHELQKQPDGDRSADPNHFVH